MPINYKNYHPRWKEISLFVRIVIAKNKCQFCGAENYKPHPITDSKVVLTVAHLDHNIKNNYFWNLKALCQRCHLSYDKEYHRINRWKNRNKNQGLLF
jgi:5-methylcytosine-specific restriction endonuclease McrA